MGDAAVIIVIGAAVIGITMARHLSSLARMQRELRREQEDP